MNCCFQANILAVLAIRPRLFQLSIYLGTLADGLGSYPLGAGPLHPTPHCHFSLLAFGVYQGLVGGEAP